MMHTIVTRVSLALCLLALVSAALFAVLVTPAAVPAAAAQATALDPATPRTAPAAGAALFERHCARCHDAADIAAALRADGGDDEAAIARVLAILKKHGAASDAEDGEIIAFLRAIASSGLPPV